MTTATADPAATGTPITISTTPSIGCGTSLTSRSITRSPAVGVVGRVVAGATGAALGLAIGLVSAGFDTTRLLLGVGVVALTFGSLVALVTGPTVTSGPHR